MSLDQMRDAISQQEKGEKSNIEVAIIDFEIRDETLFYGEFPLWRHLTV